ncbi:MAG TPA: DUF6069 family protein [Solirubrobacteraceae bacterium]|jgi:hypothetical protein
MSHETRAARSASFRATVIVLAAVAAGIVWLAFDPIGGMDLQQPTFDTAKQPTGLGLDAVLAASLAGGMVGWAALAVLERLTAHPARNWTILALAALLVSLGGPLNGDGITTGNRLVLVLMHLVVGGVLVGGLRGGAVSRRPATARPLAAAASARKR